MADTTARNERKVRRGYVVSDKMDKTVVVQIEDRVKHALYGKVMRKNKKVKVHYREGRHPRRQRQEGRSRQGSDRSHA